MTLDELEKLGLDCGDSICVFARSRTGMRTNGGCRCLGLKSIDPGTRRVATAMLKSVPQLIARVRELEGLARLLRSWVYEGTDDAEMLDAALARKDLA